MTSKLKSLIKSIVREEFSKAPKMGDIEPTPEDAKDRPGMEDRPEDGMDVDQHHKMMWAEEIIRKEVKSSLKEISALGVGGAQIISRATLAGMAGGNIFKMSPEADEQRYKQMWVVGNRDYRDLTKHIDKVVKEEVEEELNEMSAISGGGAGMASSGKVSATSGGNAWKKQDDEHELMWSGDEPNSKRPKKSDVKKKSRK